MSTLQSHYYICERYLGKGRMQHDISTKKIRAERQIMKDMRLKKFSCIIAFKYIPFNRQIHCKVTKL